MTRRDQQKGVVLILVLWTIALFSALAMAAATTFREFAGVVVASEDRAKADALLNAGLETAASLVGRLGEDQQVVTQDLVVTLATGSAYLRLSDEAGRIDINRAPVKVLSALLRHVGADNAEGLARSIEALRSEADEERPQPGSAQQTSSVAPAQSSPGGATEQRLDKSPAFTDVRQLSQIGGLTSGVIAALTPLATVFGDKQVNALTASPEVLSALPGIERAQIDALLVARQHPPVNEGKIQGILGPSADYVALPKRRSAISIDITARLKDGYAETARATIVVLPHDALPYRVLAWTPLSDQAPVRPPRAEED
jgi:general secretion pathway protein K